MNRWLNWISNAALVALFLAGLAYLLIAVARIDPTADPFRVTLHLPTSGGLLGTSPVTYRGVEVGKVTDIRLRPDGVAVDLRIDEGTEVPADSEVRVAGLSVAGEQYVDFRPRTDEGPLLADGTVIDDASTPTHFSQLLTNITELANQADPAKLRVVFTELADATSGAAQDVQALISGGDYLLAGLEEVLPETIRILRNGGTMMRTVAELRGELRSLGKSGKVVARELKAADPDLRRLLDSSPGTLRLVHELLADIGPDGEALLHNLGAVGAAMGPRSAALGEFFPWLSQAGDILAPLGDTGRLTVQVDLWPKPVCDYGTPRRPPTEGGWPEPRLDARCEQAHPEMQQRGSYNAPRPANDPTARGARNTSSQPAQTADRPRSTATTSSGDQNAAMPSWFDLYPASSATKGK